MEIKTTLNRDYQEYREPPEACSGERVHVGGHTNQALRGRQEPAGDPQRPGRIVAEPATLPAAATDLAGCAIVTEVPVPLFEQTGDVAGAWEELALRATTTGEEAQVVPERTTDLTGRPGVTVRVPYYLDDRMVSAELTFDTTTGDLLQSIGNEFETTVFLAIGQP